MLTKLCFNVSYFIIYGLYIFSLIFELLFKLASLQLDLQISTGVTIYASSMVLVISACQKFGAILLEMRPEVAVKILQELVAFPNSIQGSLEVRGRQYPVS